MVSPITCEVCKHAWKATEILTALGFARTGEILRETTAAVLHAAARQWRDARLADERTMAADVLARAGWFRKPAASRRTPNASFARPARGISSTRKTR